MARPDAPIQLQPDRRYFAREQESRLERRASMADELYGEWRTARDQLHHLEQAYREAAGQVKIAVERLAPLVMQPGDPEPLALSEIVNRLCAMGRSGA